MKNVIRRKLVLVVFLLITGFIEMTATIAGPITVFDYTANELGGDGVMTGTFGYDLAVLGVPDLTWGGTVYDDAGYWNASISGGALDGITFAQTTLDVIVRNDIFNFDSLVLTADSSTSLTWIDIYSTVLTTISTEQLPTTFDYNDWTTPLLRVSALDFGKPSGDSANFIIVANTQEASPIPESTTVAFLGIGIVGLAGVEIRRRRKRNIYNHRMKPTTNNHAI